MVTRPKARPSVRLDLRALTQVWSSSGFAVGANGRGEAVRSNPFSVDVESCTDSRRTTCSESQEPLRLELELVTRRAESPRQLAALARFR